MLKCSQSKVGEIECLTLFYSNKNASLPHSCYIKLSPFAVPFPSCVNTV